MDSSHMKTGFTKKNSSIEIFPSPKINLPTPLHKEVEKSDR